MTTLVHRASNPVSEMLDWLDSLPTFVRRDHGGFLRVEDYLDGEHYVVRAELPGLDPDKDVSVTISGDALTIRAERREEPRDRRHSEFHYGIFERSLTIPRGVHEEDVSATYADGVLEVRVPVPSTEEHTRSIPVSRTAAS